MAELTREQLIERGRLIEIGRQQEQSRQPSPSPNAAAPSAAVPMGAPSGITPGAWDITRMAGALGRRTPEGAITTAGPEELRRAIPLAGGLMAGPVAGATGMPLLAAEALTGATSEAASQLVTGERLNAVDILLAGGLPIALRGLFAGGRGAMKWIGKRLPGAAAGLHEKAIAEGQALVASLKPDDLDALKQVATGLNKATVPMRQFRKTAMDVVGQEMAVAQTGRADEALRWIGQIDDMINATQSRALPLGQVTVNLERIGARIGELRRAQKAVGAKGSTADYNALRHVYKALVDSMNDMPPGAAEPLQELRRALRTNFGALDLEHILDQATGPRQVDGLVTTNWRKVYNAWTNGKEARFIQESFPPEERAMITAFIRQNLRLPPLPPPQGVMAGSARVLTRTAGAGGIIGYALGPAAGTLAAGLAAVAPPTIARAMMSDTGRRALTRVLSDSPILTPEAIEFLATVTSQAASGAIPPGGVAVPPGLLSPTEARSAPPTPQTAPAPTGP